MRILLTNNTLAMRAGSELYVHDVAVELLNRGHQPIAFSTVLGDVAGQLRAATVPVIDDLDDLGAAPDIIHGQHHFETLTAVLHFPDVPAINFCHGWAPQEEEPLIFPRVLRYVAVDDTCRDRLVCTLGIQPERIRVILNFVDTARFLPRPRLPDIPRRALAFGNSFTRDNQLDALEEACRKSDIELDVAGLGIGRDVTNTEGLLPAYDLVFAKARSALEAMAIGTAVILCGPRGFGPMVTSQNWSRLRRLNFGVRALALPITAEAITEQIGRYDPEDASAVCELVRAQARLTDTVDQLIELYEEVITEFRMLRVDPGAGEIAASRHLNRYAATFRGYGALEGGRLNTWERAMADALWPLVKRADIRIAVAESDAVAGAIDIADRRYGVLTVKGWAADRALKQPCKVVVFVQNDRCIGVAFPHVPRPDVAEHLGAREVAFGFELQVKADECPLRVLALMESGEVFDISGLAAPAVQQILGRRSDACGSLL